MSLVRYMYVFRYLLIIFVLLKTDNWATDGQDPNAQACMRTQIQSPEISVKLHGSSSVQLSRLHPGFKD